MLDFQIVGVEKHRIKPHRVQTVCYGLISEKQGDTGFYRVRMTVAPLRTPKSFRAVKEGLILDFYTPLNPESVANLENGRVQSWEYRWSKDYGSPQLKRSGEEGRDAHPVQSATLSADGKTAFLKVPTLTPTMQFHVDIKGEFADGVPLDCYLHGTIQVLEEVDNIEAQ